MTELRNIEDAEEEDSFVCLHCSGITSPTLRQLGIDNIKRIQKEEPDEKLKEGKIELLKNIFDITDEDLK